MKATLDLNLSSGILNGAAPGAVAIVVNRDEVLWEGAAGERAFGSGVPMTKDTVGAIFSMTKAITGTAAMQLVEQRKIDLDAPAGEICPWLNEVQVLEGFDVSGKPVLRAPTSVVTLRNLLTHTSGFTYEMWNANDAQWRETTGTPSLTTQENKSLEVPLAFDPGTRWEYSIGIDWAGKIIEAVSGMTLGEYFAKYITGPLGMSDTAFERSPSMLERASAMHARLPDGSCQAIELPAKENSEFESGGGGLFGTMNDYGKFLRMILNDGELNGVRILKPETVATMCENHIGGLRVTKLKSMNPLFSNDAEFFPGQDKSWGLTFQINETAADTGRPAGTLMWAGLANSYFWIDRSNGIGGAYLSQLLPFGDEKSMNLFFELEQAVYQSLS